MKRDPLLPTQRLWRAGIVLSCVAGLALLMIARHVARVSIPSTCAVHSLTGLPCPLCGGTRAAEALFRGDFHRALTLNAVAIPAVALLIVVFTLMTIEAAAGRTMVDWQQWATRATRLVPYVFIFLLIWWIPQLIGAFQGSKAELLDLRNPIARTLNAKIHPLFE